MLFAELDLIVDLSISESARMAVFRLGQNWNRPFGELEREVDRLLKTVQLSFQGLRYGRQYPPVNIYELDAEYVVTAELPGLRGEDLDLSVGGGVLTIRGSRPEADIPSDSSYRRQERAFGTWQRSLPLPERVLDEEMSAELNDGILRIRLPKAPEEAARQIQVSEG